MVYDDVERSERTLFSLSYRASVEEQKAIYLLLIANRDWVEWSAHDDLIKYGSFDATSEAGLALSRKCSDLYRRMIRATDAAIRKVLGE